MLHRRSLLAAFTIAMITAEFAPTRAEDALSTESRVALQGYDPVSYFTEGHPEKGQQQFSAAFDDAVYWFVSEEHRAMFVAAPDAYAPQYGGYCAISMSQDKKAEPDPQAWTIADGKLYVFRSPVGVELFKKDGATIANLAEKNWSELNATP